MPATALEVPMARDNRACENDPAAISSSRSIAVSESYKYAHLERFIPIPPIYDADRSNAGLDQSLEKGRQRPNQPCHCIGTVIVRSFRLSFGNFSIWGQQ
jgi:hypothetical protein